MVETKFQDKIIAHDMQGWKERDFHASRIKYLQRKKIFLHKLLIVGNKTVGSQVE